MGLAVLNTSVLNKTPRDCTAPNAPWMYSPCGDKDPILLIGPIPLYTMNKSKKNKKSRKQANIPAAYVARPKARRSSTTQSGDGKITVRNSEYLADITCTAPFEVVTYPINPGLGTVFMWLSSIANNYEFYRFKKLLVNYRPLVGTSTSGNVMMTFDFDAADVAPTSKQRLMSYMNAVQSAVYSPISLDAASANLKKFALEHFTRPEDVPDGKDVKTYDIANLYVATSGGPGTITGSLYIDYEVEFSTPHTPGYAPWLSSATLSTTTSSLANPLQGAAVTNASSVAPILDVPAHTMFNIKKAGEYLLNTTLVGTGIGAQNPAALWMPDLGSGATVSAGQNIVATNQYSVSYAKLNVPKDNTRFSWIAPAWTTLTSAKMTVAPFLNSLVIT